MFLNRGSFLGTGLLLTGLLALPGGQELRAETSVGQYLPQISDYTFDQLDEFSSTEGRSEIGPFSKSVIDDYILLSYSSWRVRSKTAPEQGQMQLEIFEMQDPPGAFGIFSLWGNDHDGNRSERLKLQVDNHYSDQDLLFWRGKYVFHATVTDEASADREDFRRLAASLIEAIPLLNVHPVTVIHLPTEGLDRQSIRLYLGKSSFRLNQHFPRSMAAQLGFEDSVEVAFAEYGPEKNHLFLAGYPTVALAAHYAGKLQDAMQSYFSEQGIYMKRSGVIVSIFFGPEQEARDVLSEIQYVPVIQWIYRKKIDPVELRRLDTSSFLALLARSLIMTMLFCAVTLAGGFAAGVLRYQAFKRIPYLTHRDDMVVLNLHRE